MTTSDLGIINAAATRTGNDPITSISSADLVAVVANANYEDLVKGELANHPWKRASKIAQLSRLNPDVEGDPPDPWSAAYQLPNDLVEIRSVMVGGATIDYEVHGDTILCDASSSDEVVLLYVWRAPEADWPAWFRLGMIYRCEAMLLRAIGERYDRAEARDKTADGQFATARNRDSQSQPPRDPLKNNLLAARVGGGARG